MDVSSVDVLRVQLEATLAKLQAALKHWQTWEAEYEGLKEELADLPPDHSPDDVIKLSQSYVGVLTRKDVDELLGIDKAASPRDVPQILGLLDRRNDYVRKNIETLKRQLEAGESKLEKVAEVSSESHTEDGLPITDIYEELDEDGNVISGRTSRPADLPTEAFQALKKAGVEEEDLVDNATGSGDKDRGREPSSEREQSKDSPSIQLIGEKSSNDPLPASAALDSQNAPEPQPPIKRVVRFTDDIEVNGTNDVPAKIEVASQKSSSFNSTEPPNTISQLAKGSFDPSDRVVELDSDDEIVDATRPKRPIEESPEDARLRAQMLEYNMRAFGEIVAQIDLEEGEGSGTDYDEDVDYDFDDDDGDDDAGSNVSDAEEEDQYGLNRGGVMTDAYVKEMLALEQRLKARMFENVGPDSQMPRDVAESSVVGVTGASIPAAVSPSAKPKPRAKQPNEKAVRFAEDLDIAPTLEPPTKEASSPAPRNTSSTAVESISSTDPVKETIIERRLAPKAPLPTSTPAKKPSRFKSSRQAPPESAPNTIRSHLAKTIVEHSPAAVKPSTTSTSSTKPPSRPSEFDPATQQRQLESEYYRMRNRLVHKEGGFERLRRGEDEEEVSADEEDGTGEPRKRVSLFKAARVSGWG